MAKKKQTILLGVVLFVVFLLFSGGYIYAQNPRIIILWPNPDIARPNLQLRTFPYITVAPPPVASGSPIINKGPYCPLDYVKQPGEACTCFDFNSIACPAAGGIQANCPKGSFPMPLPPGVTSSWYCVEVFGSGRQEPAPVAPAGCFAACI